MALRDRFYNSDFHRVFHFKTEEGKGRSAILINSLLANIANAVITGGLYTAFLAENGIDIVRVGIISFIPYIAWALSVFSPMLLAKVRRRQRMLFCVDLVYYTSLIVATTVMPLFVKDPTAKTIWFAVFTFIPHAINALLGTGYTSWMLRFIPEGRDVNVFTSYNNMVALVCGNATALIASGVATVLTAGENSYWFLFWIRIASAVTFLIGSAVLYLTPKDIPTPPPEKVPTPLQVLTVPVRYRPFLLTALITVFWGFCTCLNANTYTYYLLETVKVPILYTYAGAVTSVLGGLVLSGIFRKMADAISPYRMVACFAAVYGLLEIISIFVAPGRVGLYLLGAVLSGMVGVGFSMGYNSLFYLNLPEDGNKDLFAIFWNMVSNVSCFVGAAFGTWVLSLFEKHGTYQIFGSAVYGSQLICCIKMVLFFAVAFFVAKITPELKRTSLSER